MVREDILGGLKTAVQNGESLENAMMALYQAGYKKEEIEEAAKVLHTQINKNLEPEVKTKKKKSNFLGIFKKKKIQEPQQKTETSPKKEAKTETSTQKETEPKKEVSPSNEIPPKGAQKVSEYKEEKKLHKKRNLILIIILILLLLGILATILILF